eukprot:10039039-Alexandrium_andersonii.AAC.1
MVDCHYHHQHTHAVLKFATVLKFPPLKYRDCGSLTSADPRPWRGPFGRLARRGPQPRPAGRWPVAQF